MILDKLMEKKDLKTFIIARKKELRIIQKELKELPEKERHITWKKLDGRIAELEYIEKNINNLKELSKKNWSK